MLQAAQQDCFQETSDSRALVSGLWCQDSGVRTLSDTENDDEDEEDDEDDENFTGEPESGGKLVPVELVQN